MNGKKPPLSSLPKMTPKEEIRAELIRRWNPPKKTEIVELDDAIGRVLAEDLFAAVQLPVYRCSAMDGVAVKSSMFADGLPDPASMQIGEDFVRADTGDDFPDAFDAVIRIEEVTLDEEQQHILKFAPDTKVKEGTGVRGSGVFVQNGELLVKAGTVLTASDLTAIAVGGLTQVPVIRKPVVAFIPTGSELVPVGTTPQRGEMIDCNSVLMKHSLRELGAEPWMHPIVKDNKEQLRKAFSEALEAGADIVILNGGSSKGSEDFNVKVLGEFGELLYHQVSTVPGRPMAAAAGDGFIGIVQPGPAAGCFNVLQWLMMPLIAHYYGIAETKPLTVRAKVLKDLPGPKPMDLLMKLHVEMDEEGNYIASPLANHHATIPQLFQTEAYFYHPKGTDLIPAGSEIEVVLLRNPGYIQ